DAAARSHAVVVHGFRAVAVGVEQERPVVRLAVPWPRPRLAVARIPGLGAGVPEGVHMLAGRRGERDVQTARDRSRILEHEELVRPPRSPAVAVVLLDAE